MNTRRQFSREFRLGAVKLLTERGAALAQPARESQVAPSGST